MIFFEWKDTYLTKISELDAQHQKLVSLINNLYADLVKCENIDQKQSYILGAIVDLIDYGCYHFDAEEKLMLEYEYPGYECHKEEHEKFKMQVTQFLKEHNEGTLILSFPILVFLRDWLSSHVLDTDKQYGPYLNEKMGA